MNQTNHRRWQLLLGSSLAVGSVVVAACVGDAQNRPNGADGGVVEIDGATSEVDSSAPPTTDGAAPQDSGTEEISDGGGLPPEDDDGGTDLDGGFDAGPACDALTAGAYVQSTCSSNLLLFQGGALTTTKYELSKVVALGSATFCNFTFASYQHRGALEVTATTNGTATFEFLDQYRKSVIGRPATVRYDVAVSASGNALTYTPQLCAAQTAPKSASFQIGSANGKKTISLRLPYGTGTAIYTYVAQ